MESSGFSTKKKYHYFMCLYSTEGGIRDYTEQDLGWVENAICMRNAGLSVETLAEYVRLFQFHCYIGLNPTSGATHTALWLIFSLITPRYLSRANFVKSIRGAQGGYRLVKAPENYRRNAYRPLVDIFIDNTSISLLYTRNTENAIPHLIGLRQEIKKLKK